MGIGVAPPCVEAGSAVGRGELLAGVPAPGGSGHGHLGFALDGGAAGPLAGREVLGQLGSGQAIGAEQPAVIGDDFHRTPTDIEKLLDAVGQPFDFVCNDTRQIVLQLVTTVVEVTDFKPTLRFLANRDIQLVINKNRVALGGECLA